MEKNILVINIGSSSKKYSLYQRESVLLGAHFERDKEKFEVTYGDDEAKEISQNVFNDSLSAFYNALKNKGYLKDENYFFSIGIRLVAPGEYFTENHFVDEDFLQKLALVADEDRAHIEPIQKELGRAKELFGNNISIVAVSDSSFHRTMPEVAKNYALPKALSKEYDIYRFGYHGISLSGIVETLSKRPLGLEKKVIICHLGSGASMTAVLDGKSVDTSMGYSPLEGLVMSSRIGNIDASAVLRLALKKDIKEVQELLYKKSGLLAISGLSDDMRVLIDAEKEGHIGAHKAIETFAYVIQKHIGMYVSVLDGVDLIVFSGTIGERSFILRDRICSKLGWLNVHLNTDKNVNAKSGDYIGHDGTLGVCVMHSDEDLEIMRKVSIMLN
jgi:acetate kinase